jgi:hypothetical protein
MSESDSLAKEMDKVLFFLGRDRDTQGQVRETHIGKILEYLIKTKSEDYKVTISKLALTCGMNPRYLRENYLDGFEAFKLMIIYMNGGHKYWEWIGVDKEITLGKSLKDKPEAQSYLKAKKKIKAEQEKEKEKKENDI